MPNATPALVKQRVVAFQVLPAHSLFDLREALPGSRLVEKNELGPRGTGKRRTMT